MNFFIQKELINLHKNRDSNTVSPPLFNVAISFSFGVIGHVMHPVMSR